jgi:hypothetical protein
MDNIITDHPGQYPEESVEYEPTPDSQIVGAYYRYLEDGAVAGHELNHWLDVERRIEDDNRLDRRIS